VRAVCCALLSAVVLCGWAATRADALLYWGSPNADAITKASLDGSGSTARAVDGAGLPRGVAVNGTHIFWTTSGAIGRANIDGTGVNASFITGANGAGGVAVNSTHIFWVEHDGNKIGRANIDGTGVNHDFIVLAAGGLPSEIAINATHIFWANSAGAIGRANINGTAVNKTFISGVGRPDGVAVNPTHIFWVNTDTDMIQRASLNGTNINASFINTGVADANDLAVTPTHIYFSDHPQGGAFNRIGRANLDGTGINANLFTSLLTVAGLAAAADVFAAPVVTTGPATTVNATNADLNATINAGGTATTYKYEYGPTTAFGTVVPATGTLSAGSAWTAVAQPPQAIWDLTPGTTYYHRACANNSVTGPSVANQVCGAVQAFTTVGTIAPSATTGAATAVTGTTAQLAGTINAHASATAYVFEYGTTTAFDKITAPTGNAGSGTAGLAVSAGASGLAPHTTYFYRLVATNSQGTTRGSVMAFTTGGTPSAPVVTTGAATNIFPAAATLTGTVNPQGQATSYTFEFGTTTSFGRITSVQSAGSFGGPVQVSIQATGLGSNTTYLYRLVATNATGTTTGPVMSFKTASL
jgi:hypothetical protein